VSSSTARELDTFIDMLQSRLRSDAHEAFCNSPGGSGSNSDMGLARLEHVRVRHCVALDNDFLIRLVELRDLGLEVEVVQDGSKGEMSRL